VSTVNAPKAPLTCCGYHLPQSVRVGQPSRVGSGGATAMTQAADLLLIDLDDMLIDRQAGFRRWVQPI
jgi:hypothetical protein